jgi:Cys-rich protein (TIGR01571 family)
MQASIFNPNATRNIVMNNFPQQQQQQGQNRPPPLPPNSSPEQANLSGNQNNSSSHTRGPPSVFVLSSPPRRVPFVYLSEPWSTPTFSYAAICHNAESGCVSQLCEMLFCHRCHMMGQLQALRNVPKLEEIDEYERRGWRLPPNLRPNPVFLFPLVCCLDVFSAGNPCGGLGWSGLGSAAWGCHVRTRIRRRYRIQGSGVDDLIYASCCAGFAVTQQEREMLNHDFPYHVPVGGGCFSIDERMERRLRNLEETNRMI